MKTNALLRGLVGVVGLLGIVLGLAKLDVAAFAVTSVWLTGQTAGGERSARQLATTLIPCATCVLLLAVGLWLVFRPPRRLVTLATSAAGSAESDRAWAAAVLRGLAMLGGVVVLALTIPDIVEVLIQAVRFVRGGVIRTPGYGEHPEFLIPVVSGVLRFVLGLYLLLGAPHVVGFHLRRLEEGGGEAAPPADG